MNKRYKINKPSISSIIKLAVSIIVICSFISCEKYLDIKSDKKLVVPSSLQDCQALIDNFGVMNNGYPYDGEASSDNHFIYFADWSSMPIRDRDIYIWKTDAEVNAGQWSGGYRRVLQSNQVLETLNKIEPSGFEVSKWNELKGQALFFRAFSFFNTAQIWAKPYDANTASQDMGIPIRLTSGITEVTVRGTLQQTYDRIITDLKDAVSLLPGSILPNSIANKSRPTKVAAYAALARVYLAMGDYGNAATNANACLQLYSTLLDYNLLNPGATNPIASFSTESIFEASSNFVESFISAKVDTNLYRSYDVNDLRRTIFFRTNTDGSYRFKGGYNGYPAYLMYCGLATDEMYLIRAECSAREGNTSAALTDLNTLLQKRWKQGLFIPFTAANADEALALILKERRKELLFRGLRWTDLRRLNKDSRFAITLKRSLNGIEYLLPPNDLRYVLLIPPSVLSNVDITQNPR